MVVIGKYGGTSIGTVEKIDRVAEHAEDLDLGFKVDELWEKALGGDLNYDSLKEQNDEDVGLPKEDDNLAPKDEYKKDDYGDGRDDY